MTDRRSIFRQEALDAWARGRDAPGGVLRVGSRWVRWSYWLLLALVVAGLSVAWTTRTDQSVTGPALVKGRDGSFVALLPAVAGDDLDGTRTVRIELDGLPDRPRLAAKLLGARPADEGSLARVGLRPSGQPAILVTGLLVAPSGVASAPAATGLDARATVVVRRERVLTLFLRQLEGMLARREDRS